MKKKNEDFYSWRIKKKERTTALLVYFCNVQFEDFEAVFKDKRIMKGLAKRFYKNKGCSFCGISSDILYDL